MLFLSVAQNNINQYLSVSMPCPYCPQNEMNLTANISLRLRDYILSQSEEINKSIIVLFYSISIIIIIIIIKSPSLFIY